MRSVLLLLALSSATCSPKAATAPTATATAANALSNLSQDATLHDHAESSLFFFLLLFLGQTP